MIVTMFPDPREQAKAIGVFAFVASAGAAVGLLAGGILTQLLNWHWIFIVNLPVGAVTAVAARRMIGPDRGAGLRAGADVLGAMLITGAMMLSVFTIVDPAVQQGWLAVKTLALGACSLALLVGFIVRQRCARNPLMPLRIFASRNVSGAAPDSRLRPAADRACLPARRRRDGCPVRPLHRPARDGASAPARRCSPASS